MNAIDQRTQSLKKILQKIGSQLKTDSDKIKKLRSQKKDNGIKLTNLKKEISKFKGVEKEIIPLKIKLKGLYVQRNKKEKILSSEKAKNISKHKALNEKKAELDKYFSELHAEQEKLIKQEEAAKAVPEEIPETAKTEEKPSEPVKK